MAKELTDLELLTELCRRLINFPEKLTMREVPLGQGYVILYMECEHEDVSRLTGREGRTILSLKTLSKAIWARGNKGAKLLLQDRQAQEHRGEKRGKDMDNKHSVHRRERD